LHLPIDNVTCTNLLNVKRVAHPLAGAGASSSVGREG
jgi:hypothetical protein